MQAIGGMSGARRKLGRMLRSGVVAAALVHCEPHEPQGTIALAPSTDLVQQQDVTLRLTGWAVATPLVAWLCDAAVPTHGDDTEKLLEHWKRMLR
ncbi:MAG TPA: hypothetical protein VK524_31535 [Polyangiaceae bacterium]|nr:hypothetical protein [Polyangiaceae bacterium]